MVRSKRRAAGPSTAESLSFSVVNRKSVSNIVEDVDVASLKNTPQTKDTIETQGKRYCANSSKASISTNKRKVSLSNTRTKSIAYEENDIDKEQSNDRENKKSNEELAAHANIINNDTSSTSGTDLHTNQQTTTPNTRASKRTKITNTIVESSKREEQTLNASIQTIPTTLDEPRKRRIASLNAEFLLHYCSASHATNHLLGSNPIQAVSASSTSETSKKRTHTSSTLEEEQQKAFNGVSNQTSSNNIKGKNRRAQNNLKSLQEKSNGLDVQEKAIIHTELEVSFSKNINENKSHMRKRKHTRKITQEESLNENNDMEENIELENDDLSDEDHLNKKTNEEDMQNQTVNDEFNQVAEEKSKIHADGDSKPNVKRKKPSKILNNRNEPKSQTIPKSEMLSNSTKTLAKADNQLMSEAPRTRAKNRNDQDKRDIEESEIKERKDPKQSSFKQESLEENVEFDKDEQKSDLSDESEKETVESNTRLNARYRTSTGSIKQKNIPSRKKKTASRKKTTSSGINTSKKSKKTSKQNSTNSEHDDFEEIEDIKSTNEKKIKQKTRTASKEQVTLNNNISSTRPRREASARASAMIIQTNEIEKTRFHYYTSATTTPSALLASAGTGTPNNSPTSQLNSKSINTTKSKITETNQPIVSNTKKSTINNTVASSDNFQVPQSIPLFGTFTAPANGPNATSTSKSSVVRNTFTKSNSTSNLLSNNSTESKSPIGISNTINISNGVKKQPQSSQNQQSQQSLLKATSSSSIGGLAGSTSNLKQVSTTTTLGSTMQQMSMMAACPGGDDSSSNDVLIVMDSTVAGNGTTGKNGNGNSIKQPTSVTKSFATSEYKLTEEVLAEHNKLHGTSSSGNGTFSNHTREYISKWVLDYKPTEDKPFSSEYIPIETFGNKTLNDPQYLLAKSKLSANSAIAAATSQPSNPTTNTAINSSQITNSNANQTQLSLSKVANQRGTTNNSTPVATSVQAASSIAQLATSGTNGVKPSESSSAAKFEPQNTLNSTTNKTSNNTFSITVNNNSTNNTMIVNRASIGVTNTSSSSPNPDTSVKQQGNNNKNINDSKLSFDKTKDSQNILPNGSAADDRTSEEVNLTGNMNGAISATFSKANNAFVINTVAVETSSLEAKCAE
jgi:hypothetical protein